MTKNWTIRKLRDRLWIERAIGLLSRSILVRLRHVVPLSVALFSLVLELPLLANHAFAQRPDPFEEARQQLVDKEIVGAGVTDKRVIESMLKTPRHEFVPRHQRKFAYYDMALPIGDRQTISSPFIVAFMTECLETKADDRVLEIGTGSGFQAAVLSPLVKDVYSIEIVESLGKKAKQTLRRLKYKNVHTKIGDGFLGWPEHAPFDKIIVTCSPEKVPQPLIDQLKEGGRMVIPVGERYQQTMYLFRKTKGKLESETLRPTLFVPMTGTAEEKRQVAPDPLNPKVANGSFEETVGDKGFFAGWYYQRQAKIETSDDSPNGKNHAVFENRESGRNSRVLQGMAIDGRTIKEIELSTWIATKNVRSTDDGGLPRVIVTFYDEQRRDLGNRWLGPWRGNTEWKQDKKALRVPPRTREIILRAGLFGATGQARFDDIRIEKKTK